jgi:hypothetical protein
VAHAEKTTWMDDDDSDSDPEVEFSLPPPKVGGATPRGRSASDHRRKALSAQGDASEPRSWDRHRATDRNDASHEVIARPTRAAAARKRRIPDRGESDGSESSDTEDVTSRDRGNLEHGDRKGKGRDDDDGDALSDAHQDDGERGVPKDRPNEKSDDDEEQEEEEQEGNARRPSKRRRMEHGDPAWDEVARKALPGDLWDDVALDLMISCIDRKNTAGNVLEAVRIVVEMARERDTRRPEWTRLGLPTSRKTLESLSTRAPLGPEFLTEATAAFANRRCLFCPNSLPSFDREFQSPHLCLCCDQCAGRMFARQYIVRKSYPMMTKGQINHARTLGRIFGNRPQAITLYLIQDIENIARESGQAPFVAIPHLTDDASDVAATRPRARTQSGEPRAGPSPPDSEMREAVEESNEDVPPVTVDDLRAAVRAFKAMGMHERVSATEKMAAAVPEKRRGKEALAAASIGRRFTELERAIIHVRPFNMGLLLLLSLLRSSTKRCASELSKVRQFVLGRPTEADAGGDCAGCLEGLRLMLSGIDRNLGRFHLLTKNADGSTISEPFACALLNPEYLSQLSQRAGTFWVSGDLGDVASQLAAN